MAVAFMVIFQAIQHYYQDAGKDHYKQADIEYLSCNGIGFIDSIVEPGSPWPVIVFFHTINT